MISAVLKHLAAAAKDLNKAELHVLIELLSRAEAAGGLDAKASSRDLAEVTGLARSSVQLAIDSLNKNGLIHSDTGTATRPAYHRLLFLDAVEIQSGGPMFRPEVARESGQGGLKSGPGVAQFPGQGGPTVRPVVARTLSPSGLKSEPVPNEKSTTCESAPLENASAPAESIEKNDFDSLIDRLQKARKSDFDSEVFEQARNLIASHHAKFAREGCQMPGLPDDQITAQFLAIAEWPRLSRTLYDLMSERKQPSFSWGWYVTVALQRVHGISPDKVRALRGRLRKAATYDRAGTAPIDTRGPIRVPSPPASVSPIQHRYRPNHSMSSLEEQIRMLAAQKSVR